MKASSNPAFAVSQFPGIQQAAILAGSEQGMNELSIWQQTNRRQTFGPHHTVCIPRNALHQIANAGHEPLRLIAVYSRRPSKTGLSDR